MDNSLIYVVSIKESGLKLQNYLNDVKKLSQRFIRTSVREGRVTINNKSARLNTKLKSEDVIKIRLDKEEEQNITPENIDLDIVYEDFDIVVVNKPPRMVVHPTKSHMSGTLANGLLYHFKENNEKCIVRLVNRLDMDTSGLVLVAKNQFAHMALARDMKEDTFKKEYIAVVHGNIDKMSGTINLPICRAEGETLKRVVGPSGQESITHYEVIERYQNADVVKLTLETGRTHQIRVHLSHIGHPIFGDVLYGKQELEYINRQALHACRLTFPHPRDGKVIELDTKLPCDMKNLIEKIKKD